jgi:PAS domain S-box-containing protein
VLLEALEEAGFDIAPIVEGLPVSARELRNTAHRIDWDVFAEFLARIDARYGGALPLEELGARMLKVPSFDFLRHAGRLFVSPKQLYEIAQRFVAPALFANVVVQHEWIDSGRLLVTGEILAGYRESVPFFRVCHGNVAALPRVLDLPASAIEEQSFSGTRGRLVLLPPTSHTLSVRVARGARAVAALGDVWRGVVRQQAEIEVSLASMRTSRHELNQLIERLPDGVFIQRDGIIRWANTPLLEMFGVSDLREVVGRPIMSFIPPEDREAIALAVRRAAMNEVSHARLEYRLLRTDGTIRRVQSGVAQLIDFEGKPSRLVVLRDVTEQHRMREQAAISDRLASIGALAAGVAHEINNPLAYVRLSAELAAREISALASDASTTVLRDAMDRILEGTDRVLAITRDLRMFARSHDDGLEDVDVPALLDATIAIAERTISAKARVVRAYRPTPHAKGSRGRLGQVFLNLLINAADAIPEGAPADHTIRVETSTDATGRAVVEVTDDGCGIPAESAPRIFDPFFTTKPVGVGTGLGLSICHHVVTSIGGEIGFLSSPGRTTFRVALPSSVAAENNAPAAPRQSPSLVRRMRARVLVVDDEPALLATITRLLSEHHDVVTALAASEALAILRDDRRFDVVITDVLMPNVSGIDFYEAVRAAYPGFEGRLVFITACASDPRTQQFLADVPNRSIEKPFRLSDLLAAIDAARDSASALTAARM